MGMPSPIPRTVITIPRSNATTGAIVRKRVFHLTVAIGSPMAKAAIIGVVPIPKATMKPVEPSTEPEPAEPTSAAVTIPHGRSPFNTPTPASAAIL